MNTFSVSLYRDMLLSIKRGNGTSDKSNAKPIFLLSIMECIAMQQLKGNIIVWFDKNLLSSYESLQRCYNEDSMPPLLVPYYHLNSAPFYHLVWKDNFMLPENLHTPSGKYFREHLQYAKLDDELWDLLQDVENREYFRRNIINRYLR